MAGFRDKAREITDQLEHGDDAHRAWLRDEAIPIIARALSEAFDSGYEACVNETPTRASLTSERQIESALALAKEALSYYADTDENLRSDGQYCYDIYDDQGVALDNGK